MKKRKTITLLATAALVAGLLPATVASAVGTEIDVIFVVDESGSMGGVQDAIGDNIVTVATNLAAQADGFYGLVGYGASSPFTPVTELPLTDDLAALETAIDGLTIDGAFEPGYNATTHALTDPAMNRRATAGTCVVLATDEPSNNDSPDAATARQEAIDALTDQGAFFFGIVPLGGSVETSFEPLATASGGSLFDLTGFVTDPANVLNALLSTCVEQVVASGTSVDVHPTSCPNPFKLGKGGVVPAAILGSETLDVSEIDPSTATLEGPGGTISALQSSISDVAGPDEYPTPETRYDCGTDGPDGYADLTLKFAAADFQSALGTVSKGDVVVVTISAETTEGATVSGTDIVWIR